MKKILIAPNELKGSLSARAAGEAIQRALHEVNSSLQTTVLPIADGGDGLLDSLQAHFAAEKREVSVQNPVGESITASYLYSSQNKLAIIEMAEASGLRLLARDKFLPMQASSFGTGQLILDALDSGA
ncbi:MAG: glycerate kinase, partial [Gammaproteobacteria bacterium]|nr:glycerate kinase [Gammaproteobacteria bacterium]